MAEISPAQIDPLSDAARAKLAIRRIATIALLAIALGFAIQGLILTAKLLSGGPFPGLVFLVDLAQGVTWTLLICLGVGIGTSIVKAREALAGIISALFAPISLAVAKASQKVMTTLIGAADQPALFSLATISALRAVEYGILGWLLAKLTQRDVPRATPYFVTGATIGVVFGGTIAALTYQVAGAKGLDPGLPQISATLVNELFSPLGCAMLIYVGQLVGRNFKVFSAHSLGKNI